MFIAFYYLQNMFQIFFVTTGKPKLGLLVTLMGGITNILLGFIFLVVFDFGIEGAALATGISYMIPSTVGLYCFVFLFSALV